MTKEQRSIRRVPMPEHRRRGSDAAIEVDSILYEREECEVEEGKPGAGRRIALWSGVGVFLALLGVAIATGFAGATVILTPKVETADIAHEFLAGSAPDAKLPFVSVPIHESAELLVPADTTKKVADRASGTIVIYNGFSEKPQRLIKNTRFETAEGLVYRIGSSLTVPGRTVKAGRVVPGSITTSVAADAPGSEYNIPLSDFTVPGFKNDPTRFAGFYARSKTPMTGGFEGTVRTPSESSLRSSRATLQSTLEKKVAEAQESLASPEPVFFKGASRIRYQALAPEGKGKDMAAVRVEAEGELYLFKKGDITRAIAEAVYRSGAAPAVEIPNLSDLQFSFKELPAAGSEPVKSLRFALKGTATLVWLYSEDTLKSALAGTQKEGLVGTLSAFPAIEKVDLVMRPFWSRSFPDNPRRITIERAPLRRSTPDLTQKP